MHYIRAEQWPNYRTHCLKPGLPGSSEPKSNGRVSPTAVSYRALGTKSPVCEKHQHAEREYSAVKAIVKAESQRKLEQALKQAQTNSSARTVCLTDMYIRPGSATATVPYDWSSTDSLTDEFNVSRTQTKQRFESVSEFGAGYRHGDGRPISANDLLPQKNRPVFLQNHATVSGPWDKEYSVQFGLDKNLFFKENIKPLKKKGSPSTSESSKRHKLIFSYLRREMMRERSVVVPLGSVPAALQVKGNITRLHNYPRQVKSAGRSQSRERFVSASPRSINSHEKDESAATDLTFKPQRPGSSTMLKPARSNSPQARPSRQIYSDPGIMTEYRLKMASLTTQPRVSTAHSLRPATAASTTRSPQEAIIGGVQPDNGHRRTDQKQTDPTSKSQMILRPKSSIGNNLPPTTKNSQYIDRVRNNGSQSREGDGQEISLKSPIRKTFDRSCGKKWTSTSSTKNPGFVKGVKYGKPVETKSLVSFEQEEASMDANNGIEGKTELSNKSSRSLTLSVFLPRESNENPHCNRADTSHHRSNDKSTTTLQYGDHQDSLKKYHEYYNNDTKYPSDLRDSPSEIPSASPLLSITVERPMTKLLLHRPQTADPISLKSRPVTGSHRQLRALHCELFGPDLCRDCQVHIERADVNTWQQAVHPNVGTDARHALSSETHRSCPSPASSGSGSDYGDPKAPFAPLTPGSAL
ncbi:hypothetical protein PoB_001647000 [Plakobranchus ocellatus]|uniref:Uncharacterized protein n=1 Tax=Plakobranchus ocellatus TaxID=259542 RepID=A0AAV3Z5Z4_9GAST|nr:hypothetical protein PoB_001647000 [Plakobranchus ocellatus]